MTLIGPVVAPAGTVATSCVDETSVKLALVPSNATTVAPPRFVPLIVTDVPTGPRVGENDEIDGDCVATVTVKLDELVAVPTGVVTPIGPLVAPAGTVAVIDVSDVTLNEAPVPLNVTDVAPVKPDPEIVTDVPTSPLDGLNDEIAGGCVCVCPHESNLNEPMRVCHTLSLSVVGCAFVYSFVYQNVHPSGSIVIAL